MLPQAEVGPLVDYIDHRRAKDPDFAIKGRSMLAMMHGMQQFEAL
jgi:hypothetical protein